MKSITILDLCWRAGILALVYQGFSYTRQEKSPRRGSDSRHTRRSAAGFLPPIAGGLVLAGGMVLLVVGAKQKA